jgi:hypothetical protein
MAQIKNKEQLTRVDNQYNTYCMYIVQTVQAMSTHRVKHRLNTVHYRCTYILYVCTVRTQ